MMLFFIAFCVEKDVLLGLKVCFQGKKQIPLPWDTPFFARDTVNVHLCLEERKKHFYLNPTSSSWWLANLFFIVVNVSFVVAGYMHSTDRSFHRQTKGTSWYYI